MQCLRCHQSSITEYQLLQQLQQQGELSGVFNTDSAGLYRGHFLLMHVLYDLQQDLLQDGVYLHVSALNIQLDTVAGIAGDADRVLTTTDTRLADYYLDWSNADLDNDAVSRLLDAFWLRYFDADKRVAAYAVLQLDVGASGQEVITAYRRLARAHHPDRGGDANAFLQVREAYELLRPSLADC